MFDSEVKLVRLLSSMGVRGRNYRNELLNLGVPKFYESFRISDSESVMLMQKLGDCLFGILEQESRKSFPIQVVAAIAINIVITPCFILLYMYRLLL